MVDVSEQVNVYVYVYVYVYDSPIQSLNAVVKRQDLDLGTVLDIRAGVHAAVMRYEVNT